MDYISSISSLENPEYPGVPFEGHVDFLVDLDTPTQVIVDSHTEVSVEFDAITFLHEG